MRGRLKLNIFLVRAEMSKIFYFCDETSFHDPWMAVGGVAIAASDVGAIRKELAEICERCFVTSEVKWQHAKARRKNIHEEYINYLFGLVDANKAHLHVRFAPFDQYDHKLSGRKDRNGTVGKMHYQLILHRTMRYYGDDNDIHVYPDNGVCTEKLPSMKDHLNLSHPKRPIKHIECRDSENEPILQLLDVTIGALASYKNKRHEIDGENAVKTQLAELALKKTKLSNLDRNSGISERRFNLWNVTPKWKKSG